MPLTALQKKAREVLQLLETRYPQPQGLLQHENAWELVVATVLAAQCTDARVNMITPALFERWPGPAEMAEASVEDIEVMVKSTGFYHNKAKNLKAAAKLLMEEYRGEVPNTLEDLMRLPGVARKTANVVMWGAFGQNVGLAVDTHVGRICRRLGLTKEEDPNKVEQDLIKLFPKESWGNVNHRMVWFGRDVCIARKPKCEICEMQPLCEFVKEATKK